MANVHYYCAYTTRLEAGFLQGRPWSTSAASTCRLIKPSVSIHNAVSRSGPSSRRRAAISVLAHSLAVSSQNAAQDLAVLKSVADYFQKGDEARRANELNNASKNASKPTLWAFSAHDVSESQSLDGSCHSRGRLMPSRRIFSTSVVRLSPRRAAAPCSPPTTQLVWRNVCRI